MKIMQNLYHCKKVTLLSDYDRLVLFIILFKIENWSHEQKIIFMRVIEENKDKYSTSGHK